MVGEHLDASPRKPCKKHLSSAYDRYASTLEAVGCICKALVAFNLKPCCTQKRLSFEKRPTKRTSHPVTYSGTNPHSLASVYSSPETCSSDTGCFTVPISSKGDQAYLRPGNVKSSMTTTTCDPGGKARLENCSPTSSCRGLHTAEVKKCTANRICNGSGCTNATEDSAPESCNNPRLRAITVKGAGCDNSDATLGQPRSGKGHCQGEQFSLRKGPSDLGETDLEKGSANLDHVTLAVQGLTCTSCESKLKKSLQSIPFVRNPQTSLLLSQAEFDVDRSVGGIGEVVRSIERMTGFGCQIITTKQHTLDILVDGNVEELINNEFPFGVCGMVVIAKNAVRITYDTKLVGARQLIQNAFGLPVRLAPLQPPQDLLSGRRHVRKTAYTTIASTLLTIPVLILAWAPLPPKPLAYGAISLALATIVQFGIAGPFYPSALRSLVFAHVMELVLLIVLSTSTAYIFSVVLYGYQVEGRPLSLGSFFETSTLLVTLIILGRLVTTFARQKAMESISIRCLQPPMALLTDTDGGITTEIDARLLQYGDIFKVMPDSCIATDGTVISGMSEVDESMVTGEVLPVSKSPDSAVIAGSLNRSGTLLIRLSHLPGHNTISEIAAIVDEAKFSKPRLQGLVDHVSGYFVPVILLLTLITFIVWILVGKLIRHQASGVVPAVTYAISVLIVSCPCAIGLAVPMVVVVAGGVAAKRGVIFKSGETLDIARKVSHVVFDKTGTLTRGTLSVLEERYLSTADAHDETVSVALGLTTNSTHPVSEAVTAHLKTRGVEPTSLQSATSITGCGLEATYQGSTVKAGNPHWLSVEASTAVQEYVSILGLADELRSDATSTVAALQRQGITVSLVSGDNRGAVEVVAAKLGIPADCVRSHCSPVDKQDYIKSIKLGNGSLADTVLFCGDGTNDAIALAEADIGVHMNEGTDVARSAADAVLVRPYLAGVLTLIDLSKVARRRIVFNFVWAFVYNLFAVLLAASAFVNARISPQYAGLGELVSVLPVVLIAAQLRWAKVG